MLDKWQLMIYSHSSQVPIYVNVVSKKYIFCFDTCLTVCNEIVYPMDISDKLTMDRNCISFRSC
jgi:hypothetical protein